METGRIVKSAAGHDKDQFYMVVSAESGFVWIADGKLRKLAQPKKKNVKHVKPTNTVINAAEMTTDKKLRTFLSTFAE